MNNFKASKVVYSLPPDLEPNMTYWVRTGNGFDLYLSDVTGQTAHKLNADTDLDARVATLERTTADTNQALVTAQSQFNEKLDNLVVGGRNLLRATSNFDSRYWGFGKASDETGAKQNPTNGVLTLIGKNNTWKHWYQRSKQGTLANSNVATNDLLNDIVNGREYTLSYDARGDGDVEFYFGVRLYYRNNIPNANPVFVGQRVTSDWVRYSHTFSLNHVNGKAEDFNYLLLLLETYSVGTLQIRNVKLQQGGMATEWSPAVEDTQTQIDDLISRVTALENKK